MSPGQDNIGDPKENKKLCQFHQINVRSFGAILKALVPNHIAHTFARMRTVKEVYRFLNDQPKEGVYAM